LLGEHVGAEQQHVQRLVDVKNLRIRGMEEMGWVISADAKADSMRTPRLECDIDRPYFPLDLLPGDRGRIH